MFGNMKRIFHHGSNPLNFVNACNSCKHHLSNSFTRPLAVSLYSTAGKSQKDQDLLLRADPKSVLGFKYVFKNRDVLKDFVADVLKKPIIDVEYRDTELAKDHGMVDAVCHFEDSTASKIVGLQLASRGSNPLLKSWYLATHTYSNQRVKTFCELKPVVVITISDHNIVPETRKPKYFWDAALVDITTKEVAFDQLRWFHLEIQKFKKDLTEIKELHDNVEVWSFFFKYAPVLEDDQIEKLSVMKPSIKKAIDSLCLSSWDFQDRVDYTQSFVP